MKNIQSSAIGTSGEYLVLSELIKKGYVAGLAPQNIKDFDIVVLNSDGTNSFPMQVKTTTKKKRAWVMQEKHETPIKDLVYCFVYMTELLEQTEIYIIDSKIVGHKLKLGHQIWLKTPSRDGSPHNDTKMRQLDEGYSDKNIDSLKNIKNLLTENEIEHLGKYKIGWMEKYKNNWALISVDNG